MTQGGGDSQEGTLTNDARSRFEEVRRSVERLHEVQLMIMCEIGRAHV